MRPYCFMYFIITHYVVHNLEEICEVSHQENQREEGIVLVSHCCSIIFAYVFRHS